MSSKDELLNKNVSKPKLKNVRNYLRILYGVPHKTYDRKVRGSSGKREDNWGIKSIEGSVGTSRGRKKAMSWSLWLELKWEDGPFLKVD